MVALGTLIVVYFWILCLPSNEWQQIDDTEHEDPYAVDEVPVHLSRLDSKVLFRGESAAQ